MTSAMHQHESAIGKHMSPFSGASSHLPPCPTPVGCHRALALGSLLIHQTPTGYLFYIW